VSVRVWAKEGLSVALVPALMEQQRERHARKETHLHAAWRACCQCQETLAGVLGAAGGC
jgi:hypothetical protein